MNIQHYLRLFQRRLWLLALIFAIAVGAALVWLELQSPKYRSRAVLEVQTEAVNIVNIKEVQERGATNLEALNTVVQSLSSSSVMLAAARATDWQEWVAAAKATSATMPTDIQIADAVRQRIQVALRRNTRLIDVVAEHEVPEKARQLAAGVVTAYAALQEANRSGISQGAIKFLMDEAEKLKKKLEDSENKLARYRLESNAVSLDSGQNIVGERLTDLNKQVTEANTKRAEIDSDLKALQQFKTGDTEGLLRLQSVAVLPEVTELRQALQEKESEFAALKERYKEKHPVYIAMAGQLSELHAKLKTAVGRAEETLRQRYATFVDTEEKLKELLAAQEKAALGLGEVSIPYNALQREVETDKSLYEAILARLKETNVTQGLTVNPFRVIEEPSVNPNPVSSKKLMILLIAASLGLASGASLVLLLDQFDSSIRTVDEAEDSLELPVLVALPEGAGNNFSKEGLVMVRDPGSSVAEGLRTLRASLCLFGDERRRSIILMTSSIPDEGKTFCSSNCALALAQQGLRTLVIDADLRRPSLSALFPKAKPRKNELHLGLSDLIRGQCEAKQAVRQTPYENLWVLPAGTRTTNPAELLAQNKTGQLITQLAMQFDRIIIDSPPINSVGDTLCLVPFAHIVCLVVRYGITPRATIRRAIQLLENAGAHHAGLVINRMPAQQGPGYYHYHYTDAYVTDSVYSAPKRPDRKNVTPSSRHAPLS